MPHDELSLQCEQRLSLRHGVPKPHVPRFVQFERRLPKRKRKFRVREQQFGQRLLQHAEIIGSFAQRVETVGKFSCRPFFFAACFACGSMRRRLRLLQIGGVPPPSAMRLRCRAFRCAQYARLACLFALQIRQACAAMFSLPCLPAAGRRQVRAYARLCAAMFSAALRAALRAYAAFFFDILRICGVSSAAHAARV